MKESNRIMRVITPSISLTDIKIKREIEMERVITVLKLPVFCSYYCHYRVFRALISPTQPGIKGTQILSQTLSRTHAPGNTQARSSIIHTPRHGHLRPHTRTLLHTVILLFSSSHFSAQSYETGKKAIRTDKNRGNETEKRETCKFANKYRQMEERDWGERKS